MTTQTKRTIAIEKQTYTFAQLAEEIERLSETGQAGEDDMSILEWLQAGSWSDDEELTLQSLAGEWDEWNSEDDE